MADQTLWERMTGPSEEDLERRKKIAAEAHTKQKAYEAHIGKAVPEEKGLQQEVVASVRPWKEAALKASNLPEDVAKGIDAALPDDLIDLVPSGAGKGATLASRAVATGKKSGGSALMAKAKENFGDKRPDARATKTTMTTGYDMPNRTGEVMDAIAAGKDKQAKRTKTFGGR